MLKRFADAATMAKMRPEIADNLRRCGGPPSLLITSGAPAVEGKTLAEVAKERKVDPVDAAIAIIPQRETGVASFNPTETDITDLLKPSTARTSSVETRDTHHIYCTFTHHYS